MKNTHAKVSIFLEVENSFANFLLRFKSFLQYRVVYPPPVLTSVNRIFLVCARQTGVIAMAGVGRPVVTARKSAPIF